MERPKLIMHNSISLDGSFTDFEVNMELHYQIAGKFKADANLIGSNTIKIGIEIYSGDLPPENETDFQKPDRDTSLPYWIIVDTKGITKGLLHACRSFEFCKDVIILISKQTGQDYIDYLKARNYDFLVYGEKHVDFEQAFNVLMRRYAIKTTLIDAGPTLTRVLLSKGLIDEISLLIHPILVGKKQGKLLACLNEQNKNINLKLLSHEKLDGNLVLLRYQVQQR
ncbi:MAG: RibD family protein [Dehalococcoidia bacterium]|nr:MAG: RibD family protein [Dehalococcoidia bacterium]